MRVALRKLQSLGFVEHEPYRGTRVHRITEEELAEIYLRTMMKRGVNA